MTTVIRQRRKKEEKQNEAWKNKEKQSSWMNEIKKKRMENNRRQPLPHNDQAKDMGKRTSGRQTVSSIILLT
jgi:hypothetical protein